MNKHGTFDIHLRVKPEIHEKLRKIAYEKRTNITKLILKAIEDYYPELAEGET